MQRSEMAVVHDTFVLERVFPASPSRVFAAYADVDARTQWGTPSAAERIVYSASDFRVGGCDAYRCGPKDDLKYTASVQYHDIVADQRIVYAESVRGPEGLLCVSLVTWLLHPTDGGCRLVLTDQLVSMVGTRMVEGSKHGTNAALDNLARSLGPQ